MNPSKKRNKTNKKQISKKLKNNNNETKNDQKIQVVKNDENVIEYTLKEKEVKQIDESQTFLENFFHPLYTKEKFFNDIWKKKALVIHSPISRVSERIENDFMHQYDVEE